LAESLSRPPFGSVRALLFPPFFARLEVRRESDGRADRAIGEGPELAMQILREVLLLEACPEMISSFMQ